METTLSSLSPARSLSRPISPLTTALATIRKNLQITRRYLPNLIGNLINLAVRMAFFLLLANSASFQSSGSNAPALVGRDLFIFFQGALLLFVFNGPTVWGPINAVSNDLYNGTLEYLYSNPCSRYAYYVGSVVADVLVNMITFLPLYLFLVIYSQNSLQNMLLVLLVCVVVLTALTALGIMLSLLALLWRQVGSIAGFLGVLFEMLAGAYLPIHAFPQAIQYLAYLLPHTWGYDLIRYYSFGGRWTTILPVWLEWGLLVLFAILFTIISRYLLGRAEDLAKRTGLHVI